VIPALCLALVLDASQSVDADEWRLQVSATAEAIRQPAVARAAQDGLVLTAVVFASEAVVAVPPTADHRAFAAALEGAGRAPGIWTNVAAAVSLATEMLLGQECERRVMDVSGDGEHNYGPSAVSEAVETAQAADIVINVLPIVDAEDRRDVTAWFRDNLAAPTGGFTIPAEWSGFARAIRAKLAMEVASR
jgi:Ca-activated chloride channel family protein